jgi:hypothetical protein
MSVKSFAEAVKEGVTRYTRGFGVEQAEAEEAEFAAVGSDGTVGGPGGTALSPSVASSSAADVLGRTQVLVRTDGGTGTGLRDSVSVMDAPWGAKGDGIQITDASIASGSKTLSSSAQHVFSILDVGKIVNVTGGGASAAVALNTKIDSVAGGNATLHLAAGTTVSGGVASFATDDTTSIQAAMTACGAIGGTIYGRTLIVPRPVGRFYGVTGTLTIGKWIGFKMLGQGRRTSVIWQFTDNIPIVEFNQALMRDIEYGDIGTCYEQVQPSANTGAVAIALNTSTIGGMWSFDLHDLWVDGAYMGVGNINGTANHVPLWSSEIVRPMFSRMSGGLINLTPASGAGTNGQPDVRIDDIFCQNDINPYTSSTITSNPTLPAVQTQGEIHGEGWDIEGWVGQILVNYGKSGQTIITSPHIERHVLNTNTQMFSTTTADSGAFLSIKGLDIFALTLTNTSGATWQLVQTEGTFEVQGVIQLGSGSAGVGGNFGALISNAGVGTLDILFGNPAGGVTTTVYKVWPYNNNGSTGEGSSQAVTQLNKRIPSTRALGISATSFPLPCALWLGKQLWVSGNGEVSRPDQLYVCIQGPTGAYRWVALSPGGIWTPDEAGYLGWNFDTASIGGSTAPAAGQEYDLIVQVPVGVTMSSVALGVATAGSGATKLANCFVGVRDTAGVLLGLSEDASTTLGGTTDEVVIPIAVQSGKSLVTVAPYVVVTFLIGTQSTTALALFRGAGGDGNIFNVGTPRVAAFRSAHYGSAQTTLPGERAFATSPTKANDFWVGVK